MADRPTEAFSALPDHWHTAIAEYTTHRIGCPADEGDADCECAVHQFRDTTMVALAEHLGLLSRQEDGEREATYAELEADASRAALGRLLAALWPADEPMDSPEHGTPSPDYIVDEAIKRLAGSPQEGDGEKERMQAALEDIARCIWDGSLDGADAQDIMERHGLLVPGEPTEEFREEWGDDITMYVLSWSPRRLKGSPTETAISGGDAAPQGDPRRPLQGEEDNQEENDPCGK